MSTDLDRAIVAAARGKKSTARELLRGVLQEDPQNVRAWLWMSRVAENERERQACLQQALRIDPDNKRAKEELEAPSPFQAEEPAAGPSEDAGETDEGSQAGAAGGESQVRDDADPVSQVPDAEAPPAEEDPYAAYFAVAPDEPPGSEDPYAAFFATGYTAQAAGAEGAGDTQPDLPPAPYDDLELQPERRGWEVLLAVAIVVLLLAASAVIAVLVLPRLLESGPEAVTGTQTPPTAVAEGTTVTPDGLPEEGSSVAISAAAGARFGQDGLPSVLVSPGAVPEDDTLVIRAIDGGDPAQAGALALPGTVYEVELAGGDFFQQPVQVGIPYDPALLPEGRSESEILPAFWHDGQWYALEGEVDEGGDTVTVSTLHDGRWSWAYPLEEMAQTVAPAQFWLSALRARPENAEQARALAMVRQQEFDEVWRELEGAVGNIETAGEPLALGFDPASASALHVAADSRLAETNLVRALADSGQAVAAFTAAGEPMAVIGKVAGPDYVVTWRDGWAGGFDLQQRLAEAARRYREAVCLMGALDHPESRSLNPACVGPVLDYYRAMLQTQGPELALDYRFRDGNQGPARISDVLVPGWLIDSPQAAADEALRQEGAFTQGTYRLQPVDCEGGGFAWLVDSLSGQDATYTLSGRDTHEVGEIVAVSPEVGEGWMAVAWDAAVNGWAPSRRAEAQELVLWYCSAPEKSADAEPPATEEATAPVGEPTPVPEAGDGAGTPSPEGTGTTEGDPAQETPTAEATEVPPEQTGEVVTILPEETASQAHVPAALQGVWTTNARQLGPLRITSKTKARDGTTTLVFEVDNQGNSRITYETLGEREQWVVIDGTVYAGESTVEGLEPGTVIDDPLAVAGFRDPWDVFRPSQPAGRYWVSFPQHELLWGKWFDQVSNEGSESVGGFDAIHYRASIDAGSLPDTAFSYPTAFGTLLDAVRAGGGNRRVHLRVEPHSRTPVKAHWRVALGGGEELVLSQKVEKIEVPPFTPPTVVGLPNPASVYCGQQGYELEIREEAGGQAGYCLFPDGSECEAWAFYRGECAPGGGGTAAVGTAEAPSDTGEWLAPVDTVVAYYGLINDGQLEEAWELLSAEFQQSNHEGSVDHYRQGYEEMNLCSVVAQDAQLLGRGPEEAQVSAHLVFATGDDCSTSNINFDFYLVYDRDREVWLVDHAELQ